jgi:hypothetical protein
MPAKKKGKTPQFAPSSWADQVPKVSKEVLSNRNLFDKSITVMHLNDQDFFFRIDGVASTIWIEIDGQRSVAEIISKVAKRHALSSEEIIRPCKKFFKDLVDNKLISLQ